MDAVNDAVARLSESTGLRWHVMGRRLHCPGVAFGWTTTQLYDRAAAYRMDGMDGLADDLVAVAVAIDALARRPA